MIASIMQNSGSTIQCYRSLEAKTLVGSLCFLDEIRRHTFHFCNFDCNVIYRPKQGMSLGLEMEQLCDESTSNNVTSKNLILIHQINQTSPGVANHTDSSFNLIRPIFKPSKDGYFFPMKILSPHVSLNIFEIISSKSDETIQDYNIPDKFHDLTEQPRSVCLVCSLL